MCSEPAAPRGLTRSGRAATQRVLHAHGRVDQVLRIGGPELLPVLRPDLVEVRAQDVASHRDLAGVDLSLRVLELCQQAALRPVREPGARDLGDEISDPRGWRRCGDQRLGRHAFGPVGGEEALVDIGAVGVGCADRVREEVGPVQLAVVDRDPRGTAGPVDEVTVRP